MNKWIEENIDNLTSICKKITKGEPHEDLFQCGMEQFLKNKKSELLPDREKLYFFIKILKTNYYSTTSPYARLYKRFKPEEIGTLEIVDSQTSQLEITIEWVREQIEIGKKNKWYYYRLFELYIEENCNLTALSRRTTIPMVSLSRDIAKVRNELKQARKNYLNNN